MIEGISNNNNINPNGFGTGERNGYTATVSGEAQSLFIDTSLLDTISLYTENIGAQYGGFTGGVVDAKLKDARMDRWHAGANFRYTKDSWAKYHLNEAQENVTYSTSESYQPEFNKYEYSAAFDGPLSEHWGLLVNYGRQYSKIPLWSGYNIYNADGTTDRERRVQYRENENFLMRLNTHKMDDFEASLTAIYAPYAEGLYQISSRYSDYDTKSGGFSLLYDMKNALQFGVLEHSLGVQQSQLSRIGSGASYYRWAMIQNGTTNWFNDRGATNAYEGGYGNVEQEKKDFSYKGVLNFDEIMTGALKHEIKLGLEAQITKASYNTKKVSVFYSPQKNSSAAGSKDNGILEGEQWTKNKYEYAPQHNKRNYITEALFLEDTIKYDRFTIRPGLRISSDTLTDNVDIAPRLFVNADIFNDNVLNIYGGANRYYGGQILSYALVKNSMDYYSRTGWDEAWKFDKRVDNEYNLGDLKTPYSDEFNIGASLNYNDAMFKAAFVTRDHKNQIKAKSKAINSTLTHYEHTNNGKTNYWGLTLSASKEYALGSTKHFSELSATRSNTKSNMMGVSGFTSTDGTYSPTHVTYNSQLVLADEVPATQFNAPWVATYTHLVQVLDSLRMGAVLRYEKGGDGLKQLSGNGLDDPNGLPTRAYELKHYGDTVNVDLSVNYDLKIRGNKFIFGLEALNLLNRKNDTSSANGGTSLSEEYAMGRQFYANFKYEF
jgi:hypothetical protein